MDLPLLKIKNRKTNSYIEKKAIEQGLHPILAKIIAARFVDENIEPLDVVFPKLSKLSSPQNLKDINKAAKRIAKAIINAEYIGLETDHDCDGQTSHAVFYYNLVNHFRHPKEKIRSYIGDRLKEGYGLTESLANRILTDDKKVSLLITADNGSTDEPRIKKLQDNNIDVIISDHHEIQEQNYPSSAYAFLNPTRADCNFSDKYIAGCMVAWLLMTAVRKELIEQKYLSEDSPNLKDTLDFVAVGTVADCVSLSQSYNNRVVVKYGLTLIEKKQKPCWQALEQYMNFPVNSEDLAFKVAPLLNSDGRLATAFKSVSFLLSDDYDEATKWIEVLKKQNENRKNIQKEITNKGIKQAKEIIQKNFYSICIFLEDSHAGVHGISASRIKDIFGRPTVFLTPKLENKELVTGSVRGIDYSFNVKQALDDIYEIEPDIFLSFGGHVGAGGLTIKKENVTKFSNLFEAVCKKQLEAEDLGPVIFVDGELKKEHLNLDFIKLLEKLAPFGKGFEAPIFTSKAVLSNIYPIGDGSHARLSLKIAGRYYKAVCFNIHLKINNSNNSESFLNDLPFNIGDNVQIAYRLVNNFYQGINSCELQIEAIYPSSFNLQGC